MIKKYFFIIFIYIFIPLNTFVEAQNITYANFDKIIKNSNVGKKIIDDFSNKNKKILDQIKDEEKKLITEESNLINQKNVLSEEEYKKKSEVLKNKVKNFNENNRIILDKFKNDKDKAYNLLIKEVNSILGEFANKNNIDLVLTSNHIIIGKSNLDITETILKLVNDNLKKIDY